MINFLNTKTFEKRIFFIFLTYYFIFFKVKKKKKKIYIYKKIILSKTFENYILKLIIKKI